MIEDVYEPLARYRDEFRKQFATLAREKFKELTERSGVDVKANRALVAEIKKLQREGFTKPVVKGAFVQDCVFIGEDKLDQLAQGMSYVLAGVKMVEDEAES